MKENDIDKNINDLFDKVNEKKKKISGAVSISWKTNCSFSSTGGVNDRINLHACQDLSVLLDIYSWILGKEQFYKQAASELSIKNTGNWVGYSFQDWKDDVKSRVLQLQISKEREELKKLEARLDVLVSPEQRRLMELKAIAKELEKE